MKEEVIVIRSDEDFKNKLKLKAKNLGLSLSAYSRMVLINSLKDEK
jgi:antitoxin component of RelBE/YafQ-DinJ toxin-antitoxin module